MAGGGDDPQAITARANHAMRMVASYRFPAAVGYP
jgi:hypothetical protein